ncbi:MAG: hypothetical protein DI596_03035 [Azospira oryzae]|nr:MAG: hypothetical protein DI596_03035 [Azospira oryzae]PZP81947.1 MAG: hypothetical protein DI593_03035 [Azospira oryzae]
MPTVARWVDMTRAIFGPCRVAYARENGVEIRTAAYRKEMEAISRGELKVVAGPFLRGDEFVCAGNDVNAVNRHPGFTPEANGME